MRSGAILYLGLILLMPGCERPLGEAVAVQKPAATTAPAVVGRFQKGDVPPDNTMTNDPAHLVGVWHTKPVTLVSAEPDIVLTITRDRIEAASGCVRFAWTYRFEGMALRLARAGAGSCERTLTPLEAAFQAAMEKSTRAHHRGGRGLVFEGPESTISVFEHPE